MESMGRGHRMYVCEGGGCCDCERQRSRPDGRLLAARLTEGLPLSEHEEFISYYIEGNWMQIWGLAFQGRHGKPQVTGMPSSHDSGEEGERKICYVATAKA